MTTETMKTDTRTNAQSPGLESRPRIIALIDAAIAKAEGTAQP